MCFQNDLFVPIHHEWIYRMYRNQIILFYSFGYLIECLSCILLLIAFRELIVCSNIIYDEMHFTESDHYYQAELV